MKRRISMLLAVLFCLNLFAQTKPSKGDGSEKNPYQISDAQELLWFAELVNGKLSDVDQNRSACAELTGDIDLSEVCGEGIGSWSPIGFTDNQYSGTFDGKGYGIKNLYINGTSSGLGFFGLTKYATISNLSILSGSVFSRGNTIGALAGNAYQSTIINCHNYISVSGGKFTGGIVGYTNGSTISKCHNEGDIKLNSDFGCGGICGATYGAKVSYCYNIGKITGSDRTGAIVGSHENGASLKNSFAYNSSVRLIGYNATSSSPKQCYLYDTKNDSSKDQFASGEICYLLNDGLVEPVFFQSIGSDEYPVLNGSDVVLKDEHGYYNMSQLTCEHKEKKTVAPTCMACGYNYCTKCHVKSDTVPAIPHDTVVTVTNAPTCTKIGYSTAQCGMCDLKYYNCDTVPALGHDTIKGKTVAPKCNAEGYDELSCKRCEKVIGKTNIVATLPHDTIFTVKAPLCKEIGYTLIKCNNCNKTLGRKDTVAALGHDTIKGETVAPKCNAEGYDELSCKRCEKVIGKTNIVATLPHDTIFTVKAPLCKEIGYTLIKCNNCNKTLGRKDTVAALGHDAIDSTIHPTCSTSGYDIKRCIRCNETWGKTNYTAPTMNHDYDGDVCNVCSHQRTEEPKFEDDYYLISNARELLWVAEYVNSWNSKVNVRLISDIDLSEVCGDGIGNWIPIGIYDNGYHNFSGIFDGNGHKVYNIYHKSNKSDIAFFGNIQDAVIKDLWLSGYIRAYDNIAGLCLNNMSSIISGCVNDIDVYLDYKIGKATGLCHYIAGNNSKIENCLQHGTISAKTGDNLVYTRVGGITRYRVENTIKNCVNYRCKQTGTSFVTYDEDEGNVLYEISNNYTVLSETQDSIKTAQGSFTPEELCFRLNLKDINWGTATIDDIETVVPKAFASKIIYPVGPLSCPLSHDYKSYSDKETKIEYLYPNHVDEDNDGVYDCCGMYHSDLIAPNEIGVYEIGTAEQLKDFANAVSKKFNSINAKLTHDIDMSDICNATVGSWEPINIYKGIFDGQHHKISGLYVVNDFDAGLFSVNRGLIKNVAITKDCKIKGKTAGAICASNEGLIENCSNEANVEGNMAGGITGEQSYGNLSIKNCYNTGEITGKYVGGIAGICNSGLDFCHNYGHINREKVKDYDMYIGGVSGVAMVEDGGFPGSIFTIETGWVPENVELYDFTTSTEQFASGEVCYALNSTQDSTVWYQTLNVDPYPVLDPTHGKVLYDEEKGIYYNYPDNICSVVNEIKNEKQTASLLTFVVNRQVIVFGVDSFRIINMFGHDVTALNGSLADGIYVVVADGNVAKVVVK
ncbi:MAG: hypothetical protein MJZ00_04475 [Paludibacteraceae bacterium]|nr:hypothetical protein [Paludibacteraceae bacterium]